MVSACLFQAAETHVVIHGTFDAIVDAQRFKFAALVWPVSRCFAYPALVFSLVFIFFPEVVKRSTMARSTANSSGSTHA